MLDNRDDAYDLLRRLGAQEHPLRHLKLVGEAADELIAVYDAFAIKFDSLSIELGVAVHDAGKIQHPEEMAGPGSQHEAAGDALMLHHGVQPDVARCCITHAAWQRPDVTFKERTVALADKLWKVKREPELELLVVDEAAGRLGVGRWESSSGSTPSSRKLPLPTMTACTGAGAALKTPKEMRSKAAGGISPLGPARRLRTKHESCFLNAQRARW